LLFGQGDENSNKVNYINKNQFNISGVTLGTSIEELYNIFGKPDSIAKVEFDFLDREAFTYFYDNIIIDVADGEVVEKLVCRNRNYQTYDSLKVGDSIEKLWTVYSIKGEIPKQKEYSISCWLDPPCDTWFSFLINDNRVIEISMNSLP